MKSYEVAGKGAPETTAAWSKEQALLRSAGFPLFAGCRLGLIVDGRKGAGQIRAALIREARQFVSA